MKVGLGHIKSEIWLTIVGLLVGFAVSFAFGHFNPNSETGMSWMVGAMVFLFTAQTVLQLQKTKLRAQPDFVLRKVLIWKDNDERNSQAATRVVKLHTDDPEARMALKGIVREDIEKKPVLATQLHDDLADQVDFGIFDDVVVPRGDFRDPGRGVQRSAPPVAPWRSPPRAPVRRML